MQKVPKFKYRCWEKLSQGYEGTAKALAVDTGCDLRTAREVYQRRLKQEKDSTLKSE